MEKTHPSKNIIDLHGLTREESLVIVREALEERALQMDRECTTFLLLLDSMYIGLYLRIYNSCSVSPLQLQLQPPDGRRL